MAKKSAAGKKLKELRKYHNLVLFFVFILDFMFFGGGIIIALSTATGPEMSDTGQIVFYSFLILIGIFQYILIYRLAKRVGWNPWVYVVIVLLSNLFLKIWSIIPIIVILVKSNRMINEYGRNNKKIGKSKKKK